MTDDGKAWTAFLHREDEGHQQLGVSLSGPQANALANAFAAATKKGEFPPGIEVDDGVEDRLVLNFVVDE